MAALQTELRDYRAMVLSLSAQIEALKAQATVSRDLALESAAQLAEQQPMSQHYSDGELIAEAIRAQISRASKFVAVEIAVIQKAIGEIQSLDGCACSMDEDFCHHSTLKALKASLAEGAL